MLFVSYASQDRAAIDNLLATLRRTHRYVWLDDELGGGEAWWRTILEQIRRCHVFIFAVSNNSLASKPCRAEYHYARALHRPILPVQIGPIDSVRVTPLAATQIFDYRNPTRQATAQLNTAVQKRQAQLGPLPSPLPVEPAVPFAYLMRLADTLASPELSRHQQAEVVAELKDRLDDDRNDPTALRDITGLLRRLRDRSDVMWRIRNDIDAMLASIDTNRPANTAGPFTPPFSGPQPVVMPSSFSGPQPVVMPSSFSGPQPVVMPSSFSGPQPVVMPSSFSGPQPVVAPSSFSGPQPVVMPPSPGVAPAGTGAGRVRRFRAKWLIGGGVGLAVVSAIVVAIMLHDPRPVPVDSFLLSDSEIESIMGAPDMRTVENGDEALKQGSKVNGSDRDCMGVLYPGLDETYQDSGLQRLAWKVLEKPGGLRRAGDGNDHFVDQDVAALATTEQALAFVKRSAKQWKACTGRTVIVTYTEDSRDYSWRIGDLTANTWEIHQFYTQDGSPGYVCRRVLKAVSTFVVDIKACGDQVTDEASRIADEIASSLTGSTKTK